MIRRPLSGLSRMTNIYSIGCEDKGVQVADVQIYPLWSEHSLGSPGETVIVRRDRHLELYALFEKNLQRSL